MRQKILLVSDSPFLDSGFGRVCREIGTGLVEAGFDVSCLGWFHSYNDKVVPFRILNTQYANPMISHADAYGQLSYDDAVLRVRPDIVLAIGDVWMVEHIVQRPRDYKLICYVPIDSGPIMHSWLETFAMMDHLVVYGDYAEEVIRELVPRFIMSKIPHGVDTDVFYPLDAEKKKVARTVLTSNDPEKKFIVGCVARNNVRKQLPRMIESFSQFIHPWSYCGLCQEMTFHIKPDPSYQCRVCSAAAEPGFFGAAKKDCLLYLHCAVEDPAGHKLSSLIDRAKLHGSIAMPQNHIIGHGVPDWQMNVFYNAFDVFTIPTSGEGFGLPFLEAMASGCPVLATDYSGHVDFMKGVGEFIRVADWYTEPTNNCQRAMTDLTDHTMKLDRFYYEREEFIVKWGRYLSDRGIELSVLQRMDFGKQLREGMGRKCHERAQDYKWVPIIQKWVKLIGAMLSSQTNQIEKPFEIQVV